ncbi:MAG: hypothetical protein LC776_05060 [Acidobacteria bacterium]|nr:hypothetical protein [Acidobacteriota bacterium]
MATEVVVKHSLSDEMISAGAELTRRLDDARFIVSASLWLFTPETGGWRFVIGSPEVRTRGPRWAYKQVQAVMSRMPSAQARIPLKDITVIDSNDPLIKLLKVAIKTGGGISGIRFTNNVINGTPIEDAYIYRIT